ncbi:MAG: cation-translocating P-type ATPase [Polyangiaceae bacterium]|jgi:Cd2+/Zn2+-exporting ATPase/Cu+-exporting ATPase
MEPISVVASPGTEVEPEFGVPHDRETDHDPHVQRGDLVRIGLVALAVLVSWLFPWQPLLRVDAVALTATLVGGYPIFKEAFEALRRRQMTMELSMTIALVSALVIREAFTALVIVLFVLVAEVLEHLTVGRGRRAIKDLLAFLPRTVAVRREEGVADVSSDALSVGDVVVIKPGGRVPVDGVVQAGHSFVDQAAITGESLPVEKVPGTKVFAGTMNQSGTLDVRSTGIGQDTTFAKIVEAVEKAQESRAPIQKTADRLAGYLVYFALGAALLTFLITRDARSTISVIIVAGACGIAAGTPLAILGAVGRSARLGAIVKGGIYVEVLGRVDTIVLDKTGTLTLGDPQVVAIHPASGVTATQLLKAAATAELPSEHPLGKAVLSRATADGITPVEPDHFSYTPGKGIVCSKAGQSIVVGNRSLLEREGVTLPDVDAAATVLVASGSRFLGALEVADVVRPEAAASIAAIRRMGMRTILLTGDATSIANEVGARLGVDEAIAELLPQNKLDKVRELQRLGKCVAMVGDGINDAPALAQADVGIAMGSGTDVARESADVVLLGNDLLKLVETLRIARRCRAIIGQNFAGTLVVDGLGILLAAMSFLNPLLAAFIHVSSELLFILNSTRLLPARSR